MSEDDIQRFLIVPPETRPGEIVGETVNTNTCVHQQISNSALVNINIINNFNINMKHKVGQILLLVNQVYTERVGNIKNLIFTLMKKIFAKFQENSKYFSCIKKTFFETSLFLNRMCWLFHASVELLLSIIFVWTASFLDIFRHNNQDFLILLIEVYFGSLVLLSHDQDYHQHQ